ncbi:hypothetical protein C427_3258 [Paraglaciecola psychrophila 170]|uniref:Uncharacterized protein n=1 Tax=Paraglaciecola psychrophila 170 TaxID=1129794 RepID=K7A6T5_9ALTE|nr:hypothetical protein C427_3258 [Paraglaciecola psychrophila 170]GAC38042.1 hypothetical protein GPSY_2426 [Paraglaciecola psychrophila 170]
MMEVCRLMAFMSREQSKSIQTKTPSRSLAFCLYSISNDMNLHL